MKTLIFYGDSNTYGYDPETGRGSGGRYPASQRWTELVKEALETSFEVYEEGLVGRCIPTMKFEYEELMTMIEKYHKIDLFSIMLGTNDCLSLPYPDTEKVGQRMSDFISRLREIDKFRLWNTAIIIIAPPYMDFTGDRFYEKYGTTDGSLSLSLKKAAEDQQVNFIDAGPWMAECCNDHVHLSASGHRVFAENMIKSIKAL